MVIIAAACNGWCEALAILLSVRVWAGCHELGVCVVLST